MCFDPVAVARATATERWYPGERVGRLRASHSYGFVLLLVLVTFFFTAAVPDREWAPGALLVLQTGTLVVAVWTSGLGRSGMWYALAAAAVGIGLALVQAIGGGATASGAVGLVSMTFVLLTCVVIATGVFDQGAVNAQSVVGAICIYVLLGLLFAYVYGAIAVLGDADLFAQGTDGTPALRLYFSYVTLATLGYGDYTTASDLGHTIAVIEALMGQLYLVTVIAVLVSRLGFRRHEREREH